MEIEKKKKKDMKNMVSKATPLRWEARLPIKDKRFYYPTF